MSDCEDLCPDTKALAQVDSQGCPEATSEGSLGRGPRNTCGIVGTVNLVFLFSSLAAMRLIRRGAAGRDLQVHHNGKPAQP